MSIGKRPGPALVVAMIALVAALGGSAIALPGKSTVGSQDVKNNSIKSTDLKNDTAVKPQDLAPKARLWVEVTSQGQVVGATEPGVGVSANNGQYVVDFNQGDIGPCASTATISAFAPGGGIPAGQIATELSATSSDSIRVETTAPDSGAPAPRGFTLVVHC